MNFRHIGCDGVVRYPLARKQQRNCDRQTLESIHCFTVDRMVRQNFETDSETHLDSIHIFRIMLITYRLAMRTPSPNKCNKRAKNHNGSEFGWRLSVQCSVREADLPECAFPSRSSGTSRSYQSSRHIPCAVPCGGRYMECDFSISSLRRD